MSFPTFRPNPSLQRDAPRSYRFRHFLPSPFGHIFPTFARLLRIDRQLATKTVSVLRLSSLQARFHDILPTRRPRLLILRVTHNHSTSLSRLRRWRAANATSNPGTSRSLPPRFFKHQPRRNPLEACINPAEEACTVNPSMKDDTLTLSLPTFKGLATSYICKRHRQGITHSRMWPGPSD